MQYEIAYVFNFQKVPGGGISFSQNFSLAFYCCLFLCVHLAATEDTTVAIISISHYYYVAMATPTGEKPKIDTYAILSNAAKRAAQGGLAGAAAMGINVCTLMWMRTTINYQYRYGTTTMVALKTLYADGGIPRFYRGLIPALIQGPLSRFGDTAANTGTMAALDAFELTADMPVAAKTVAASVAAGLFRIALMPIDTLKTTM